MSLLSPQVLSRYNHTVVIDEDTDTTLTIDPQHRIVRSRVSPRTTQPLTTGALPMAKKNTTKATRTARTNAERALLAEIACIRAENEQLKQAASAPRSLRLKVSEKGGLSVYGLGRFPVTLYKEQWKALLAKADDINAFLTLHDEELATKNV